MISEVIFYGDARSEAPSAATTIGEADVRIIVYRPTASVDVFLPPLETQESGGPRFFLFNDSFFTLTIKRSNGVIITTISSKGGSGNPQGRQFFVGTTDWVIKNSVSRFGVSS